MVFDYKSKRVEKGLAITEVAAAVDKDKSFISKVENGERVPSFPLIVRLARLYGCAMDDFIVLDSVK